MTAKENYENAVSILHILEDQVFAHKIRVNKLRVEYQAECQHLSVREEDGYDQHKREDWTNVYCLDCGKFVRRY